MISGLLDQLTLLTDLLTLISDRITGAFNRSGATWVVVLDISKAFDKMCHTGHFHRRKSHGVSNRVFGPILSRISNRLLQMVLDGKSSQEYPVGAVVP